MVRATLKALFERDLKRLKSEMIAYSSEENIWKTSGAISNCGGNLCLHLIGNLKTYFGSVLNDSGYVRKRELEFSLKDVPRIEMLDLIDQTLEDVLATLDQLTNEDLEKEYPVLVFDRPQSTGHFLIHLSTHLGYHLGQINYHRRLTDI